MNQRLKKIYLAAGGACFLYYLFLGVTARFGLSMSWMWLIAGGMFTMAGIGSSANLPGWSRLLWRTLLCAGVALVLALEGFILSEMNAVPPQGMDYLIVLGAKVDGESPSPALAHRIIAAVSYLEQNPDTRVIASGGQGDDEGISEAQCIRNELIAAGIDEDRILIEDQSTKTSENLTFSMALIGSSDTKVGLVTNNFHIFRALRLAKKAGYTDVYGLAARYGYGTLPHYMVREAACTVADFFLGNL